MAGRREPRSSSIIASPRRGWNYLRRHPIQRRPGTGRGGGSPLASSANVDSLPARNATTGASASRPRGAPNVALATHLSRAPPTARRLLNPAAGGAGVVAVGGSRDRFADQVTSGSNPPTATAMKPRPLGSVTSAAAAAEGLVGAGRAACAWRPRPRGVSPKCAHSVAAAGAVHSEHRRRGVRWVPFRSLGLPSMEYGLELEARVEKVIYACRFITFLGIGGLLLGSVPCFLKGCVYVMDAFVEYYLHGGGKVVLMLVEAIDMFLIGTAMLVFGTGLYELFISNMDIAKSSSYGSNLFGLFRLPERPKWLVIKSVDDLKTKLGHVIVMVLLVGIFEKSKRVTITSCADLLCFAASIFLSSGCLYLLSRLNSTKAGSHA